MKKSILTLITAFVFNSVVAQDFVELMHDPKANFYDVKKAADLYWSTHDKDEKGNGYKPYKRWEAFMEPRVYPSGNMYLASQTWKNYEEFTTNNSTAKQGNSMIASSTWTAIGPFGAMTGSACGLPRKAGRDNFITFHPSITTTYWVGAPAGGLWKTTNDGATWTTTTDNLAVIGCSDLAIDPTNPNIMYMATGDGDAGDTYCIGVLKSIDGGATWNATGLVWNINLQRTMRRLIINPNNPQILIAASSAGIWRTANGGTSWTQVSAINAFDVEFKPGNPNVVYAGGGATGTTHSFYRSINGGTTFAVVSNGIPTSGCNRVSVAVTPNDTNYVYVLRSNSGTNGFASLHRSVAGGTVFTQMSTTPDILANSCVGTAGNGQGWYDLALAASPLNKDEVVVGGINHWRSTNGGAAWTNIGCWNSTGTNPPYIHADVHELEYTPTGILYSCNDGGIYKHTGTAWTDLSSPRNIAQQYRIGLSALTANYFLTGHQDNGTNLSNGSTYVARYCGDGMDCFIDRTNNNNMFGATPQGGFLRSTDGGTNWSSATGGMSGGAAWVAPWHQDPTVAATLYAGRSQMWRSTNSGVSWTQLTATGGSGTIVDFAIAPSNNQVLYVIHGNSVFFTNNAGTSWTNVSSGISGGSPTYVAIDPTDPNNAWVTVSGYTAGSKVFMTTNGGTAWTNVSSNLPNLPANCIVYEPGTSDRVYVGMDVGVYYKDNSSPNWTIYNTGLPNVPISDLEMSPANPGKIFAATYGRGAWKVDVVTAAPPVSSFSVSAAPKCTGTAILFNDNSSNSPTSWSWSVTPSAGVTITTPTLQNPTMNFTNGGTYTVSMQASNIIGTGPITSQTISVVSTPTVNVSNSSQTVCAGTPVTYTASGATTYVWSGGGTAAVNTYTPASSTVYTVTGTTSGCSGSRTASVTVNAAPSVSITGLNSICIGSSVVLTAAGATTYTWNTSATTTTISVSPTVTTSYTVTGTSTGCSSSSVRTVTVNPLPVISTASSSSVICLGQSANLNASGASTYTWMPGSLVGAAVVANPTTSTTYTCTGTSAAGCNGSAVRIVTVNPLPTVTSTGSSSLICTGQTATLTASGASTYTWNPGGLNGTAVAVSPTTSTSYSVTGTSALGCNNVAMVTLSVSACTGIDQIVNVGGYSLFPNPTSGKLNIQFNVTKNTVINSDVTDASGKVVMKQVLTFSVSENTQVINISNLANGLYFVTLTNSENKAQTIRIVKD